MEKSTCKPCLQLVAPPAGAWIEIECGSINTVIVGVAPPAGAWIEILLYCLCAQSEAVAPPAGAWIEIAVPMAGL